MIREGPHVLDIQWYSYIQTGCFKTECQSQTTSHTNERCSISLKTWGLVVSEEFRSPSESVIIPLKVAGYGTLEDTVDGRNPAPPGIYETHWNPINNGINYLHLNWWTPDKSLVFSWGRAEPTPRRHAGGAGWAAHAPQWPPAALAAKLTGGAALWRTCGGRLGGAFFCDLVEFMS